MTSYSYGDGYSPNGDGYGYSYGYNPNSDSDSYGYGYSPNSDSYIYGYGYSPNEPRLDRTPPNAKQSNLNLFLASFEANSQKPLLKLPCITWASSLLSSNGSDTGYGMPTSSPSHPCFMVIPLLALPPAVRPPA